MRQIDDLMVAESRSEFADMLTGPKYPICFGRKKKGKKETYINITATLDTETTNTKDDGFIWSYQMNVAGHNIVIHSWSAFIEVLEWLSSFFRLGTTRKLVVHVHNLGYECWYLLQLLNDKIGIKSTLWTSSHKVLTVNLENGIILRDSLKLFQKSLAGATKGCPHPKAVNDLDYKVYRTPETELTDSEFRYIVYDVQGLYEAIERLKREGGYNAVTLPITNTSRVLHAVCTKCEHVTGWQKLMQKLALPRDGLQVAYKVVAGGDTHASRFWAGKTVSDCNSYDFKSAHPSQMLTKKFPMGAPVEYGDATEEELEEIISLGYGWIGLVAALDLQIIPSNPDPTLSYSKCDYVESMPSLDNGRILTCSGVAAWMDSNDYQRLKMSYKWDTLGASQVWIFRLDYLPKPFRQIVLQYFEQKEALPKDTPEYNFAKICVNTIYGACAQKTIRDEYTMHLLEEGLSITSTSWAETMAGKSDRDIIKSQTRSGKLPFLWGLWTASCTRLELCRLIKIVGWDRVLYWDTDSVKYKGAKCPEVDMYNARQRELCEKLECVIRNRNGKPVYIGSAEDEHPGREYGYRKFRALHAKCYAVETDNGLEVTIAGVAKDKGRDALQTIDNLRMGKHIAPAGGQKLWYFARPLDLSDPTIMRAGYIYMEDRDYKISFLPPDEYFDGDVIAC